MQSLLRWSIENSTPQDSSTTTRDEPRNQNIDPGIIDMILGRPDAELMKEDVTTACDTRKLEAERCNALDHLEMLVESIDNANDLEKLKLWQPLISLLNSSRTTTNIKIQVLWVIGTALQNNPAAQDAYLSFDPLPTLLGFLTPSPSSTLAARAKAIYALSGLLKHNAPAVIELGKPGLGGWLILREALQDPEIAVRRKTAFVLNILISPVAPIPSSHHTPLPIASQSADVALPPPMTTHATPANPSLHTVDEPNANNPNPIHANSHSAYLRDPSRSDTAGISLEAFGRFDIIGRVVSAVTNPLPYGEDGENDKPDADFEEKAVQLLYTYGVQCRGPFTDEEKDAMSEWIEKEERESGGAGQLGERLNLSVMDLNALVRCLR